ncbi:MAG: cobalt-precorrin-5B (C(1))-methyltransferase CbiD [Candidatus Hydrogenedentota bacterium]
MLRKGVTTGACAQAAAKACALMLAQKEIIETVEVQLPNGENKEFTLLEQKVNKDYARCGVKKDAGDEDDVTDGIKIYCEIRKASIKGISIKGGKGVGIVTKHGLAVPPGEYAINPVPRKMILRNVSEILPIKKQGFVVEISVPEGEEIARKTYNPRLGIKGGISIIGTTGIVEPNSIDAYKASLSLELNIAKANGNKVINLCSGYIGERVLRERFKVSKKSIIKIGDHVGFMLEECVRKHISNVVLVGHIGKLVKVAAGMFNTHSKFGDARLETLAAFAASCGAKRELVNKILNMKLAEETVEVLKKNKLEVTFERIAERVVQRSEELCGGKLKIACILLSLKGEILGTAPKDLLEKNK